MLKADSSALKSERDDQSSRTPPAIPSTAALSCTRWTSETIPEIELPGNARPISLTRKSEASARCTRPSSDSDRNVSGTNERRAKYATIAARWVPRSAKNLAGRARLRWRTEESLHRVSLSDMEAAQALADLTEISSQIEAAVLFDESGTIEGSTFPDEAAGRALAQAGAELLEGTARLGVVTQLEVSTHEGSIFVVRDGAKRIAATTVPQPTVGLGFYDLKSCLPGAPGPEPPKRTRKRKTDDAA